MTGHVGIENSEDDVSCLNLALKMRYRQPERTFLRTFFLPTLIVVIQLANQTSIYGTLGVYESLLLEVLQGSIGVWGHEGGFPPGFMSRFHSTKSQTALTGSNYGWGVSAMSGS